MGIDGLRRQSAYVATMGLVGFGGRFCGEITWKYEIRKNVLLFV